MTISDLDNRLIRHPHICTSCLQLRWRNQPQEHPYLVRSRNFFEHACHYPYLDGLTQDQLSKKDDMDQVEFPGKDLSSKQLNMSLFDSKPVLWKNVSALMERKYGRINLSKLSSEGKFSQSTASRLKEGETSVGVDILDKCASVLGAQPWQLLHPDFDIANPVSSVSHSPLAEDLAKQLDLIQDQKARERAYALATQVLTLAAYSAPDTEQAPAPSPKKQHLQS